MTAAYYTTPDTPGLVIVHDRRGWWHADITQGTWTKATSSGEMVHATPDEIKQAEALRPPDLGGRPAVGPPIQIRLPAALLEQVDVAADCDNVTRAEMIRRLIVKALA